MSLLIIGNDPQTMPDDDQRIRIGKHICFK